MTEETVTDASGATLTVLDFDGFKMSSFGNTKDYMKNVYRNLSKFKFRSEDIFLASYPKAGCVWMFEIISMLLTGQVGAHDSYDKVASMLEARIATSIDAIPSPRIVNSHMHFEMLPTDLIEKKSKTVYLIRDYKDITVSFYNSMKSLTHYHYHGKWEDWLHLHLNNELPFADYFAYVQQWENVIQNSDLPVHIVYYEDLKSDTLNEIRRLAKFLGVTRENSVLEEISVNCQFDAMKAKYSSDALGPVQFKEGAGFFRKGKVGDWKNWYTVEQNDLVNNMTRTNVENYKTSIHFGGKYEF